MAKPKPITKTTYVEDPELRRSRALAYKVKRERNWECSRCQTQDAIVAVRYANGEYDARCTRHLQGLEHIKGQWVDSPIHDADQALHS